MIHGHRPSLSVSNTNNSVYNNGAINSGRMMRKPYRPVQNSLNGVEGKDSNPRGEGVTNAKDPRPAVNNAGGRVGGNSVETEMQRPRGDANNTGSKGNVGRNPGNSNSNNGAKESKPAYNDDGNSRGSRTNGGSSPSIERGSGGRSGGSSSGGSSSGGRSGGSGGGSGGSSSGSGRRK